MSVEKRREWMRSSLPLSLILTLGVGVGIGEKCSIIRIQLDLLKTLN